MTSFKIVIPARYESTRFPGKPLVDIAGKPMIQWVYECACKTDAEQVVIATDDKRIAEVATGFAADVCMTATTHQSGTDRLSEVSLKYAWDADDIVVNLQGDEPLTPAELITQVAENLALNRGAEIATLCTAVTRVAEVQDPNVVKVVADAQGYALLFSRAPIPWNRDRGNQLSAGDLTMYRRHLGIYAYRVSFLHAYSNMPACQLEQVEKLEQLRAMHAGIRIHVADAACLPGPGVDTPEDLEHVSRLLDV